MMAYLAHEIVLDKPRREIVIDGVEFPWHVLPDIAVRTDADDFTTVTLIIPTDNLTVIDDDGPPESVVCDLDTDLVWARDWVRRYADRVRRDLGLPDHVEHGAGTPRPERTR